MNKQQYLKKYYLSNKKRITEIKAKWYVKNRVKQLAKNKEYVQTHKEEIKARRKKCIYTYKKRGVYVYHKATRSAYAKRADVKEKQKARRKVMEAVKQKRLVRLLCEVCQISNTQAHHDDYNKPLAVRWLCQTHHTAHHQKLKLLVNIK